VSKPERLSGSSAAMSRQDSLDSAIAEMQHNTPMENELIEARAQLLELRATLDQMKLAQASFLDDVRVAKVAMNRGRSYPLSPRKQNLASQFSSHVAGVSAKASAKEGVAREMAIAEQKVISQLEHHGMRGSSSYDHHSSIINLRTPWARGNAIISSRPLQSFFLFLILVNLAVLAIEVDITEENKWYDTVFIVSYSLTVSFFVEAVLNMIFVPQWWTHKDILVDASLCVVVFLLETIVLLGAIGEGVKWLTVLRSLRIVRFAWKLRAQNAGRPVRVLLSAVDGCTWNFVWTALVLLLSFYVPALATRTVLDRSENEVAKAIVQEYFATMPAAVVTYVHIFLTAFNYDKAIIRPLLRERSLWWIGALILCYGVLMIVCVANFISGLFIEFILKAAQKSDETVGQEMLAMNDINFQDLLRMYKKIDQHNLGYFTLPDFLEAMEDEPDIEVALQVICLKDREEVVDDQNPNPEMLLQQHHRREMLLHRDREIFFHNLDILGDGEISFSDFVYGVLKSFCPPRALEQLVFDYQFTKIVKMCGESCRAALDVQKFLRQHNSTVEALSGKLLDHGISHAADINVIRKSFSSLETRLDVVMGGLDEEHDAAGSKKALSVDHAKKALEMGGLLQSLLGRISEATTCAQLQTQRSRQALSTISGDFRAEVHAVAQRQLRVLQRNGEMACTEAATAAAASQAACDSIATLLRPSGA